MVIRAAVHRIKKPLIWSGAFLRYRSNRIRMMRGMGIPTCQNNMGMFESNGGAAATPIALRFRFDLSRAGRIKRNRLQSERSPVSFRNRRRSRLQCRKPSTSIGTVRSVRRIPREGGFGIWPRSYFGAQLAVSMFEPVMHRRAVSISVSVAPWPRAQVSAAAAEYLAT
jgi:hypothetical protein